MASRNSVKGRYQVLSGYCPDEQCRAKLFFPAYDSSIECTSCGQRHAKRALHNIEEVKDPEVALHNILKNILLGNTKPKKGTDSVKVLGLSNYQCKLLSPLLTKYGMDKHSGQAKLLKDMGQPEVFNCSILGDRAFLIEQEHVEVVGYGRDRTGSMKYLGDTLNAIRKYNGNQEVLLPIHADGDGHCLVHAVSRALIGRELFWHALRENLKSHFLLNLDKYKNLFQDFVDANEWVDIIEECDPFYSPSDGEPLGLRNIHIFGLANVLKRPILLLDSILGMQSSGDYAGIFLPGLVPVEQCRGKDGTLNKPICLAWSNPGRNHYLALVGVKGRPLPKLPGWMMPKSWGMPNDLVRQYVDLDEDGACVIGGNKCLQDKYVLRLVAAMEKVFEEEYQVNPSLVADVHQYVYKSTGIVGVRPEVVLEATQKAVHENRLYKCLTCDAITESNIFPDWLKPGGSLYTLAERTHGKLRADKKYSFPMQGLICQYNPQKDELVPDMERSKLTHCGWCQGSNMRQLKGDNTVKYMNGDRTTTRTQAGRCQCGFKHYWDGKEFDNLPQIFPVTLEWNGKVVGDKVVWFQFESEPGMNSNVFEVAQKMVQKHFPGEFGSERLVQKVVDNILRQTAAKEEKEDKPQGATAESSSMDYHEDTDASWRSDSAYKIILTGHKHKTMHKEELTMSETEKNLKKKVETNAAQMQKRKTSELSQREAAQKTSPKKHPESPKHQKTAGGGPASPTVSTSTASPPPVTPSSQKKIRVTTSDGRQTTLSLDMETTFKVLQEKISSELQIPPERQKIKHGFPPRELRPPEPDHEEDAVPIQHGERVTVEVLPDTSAPVLEETVEGGETSQEAESEPMATWGSADQNASADDLIKSLEQMQEDSADNLDRQITSLVVMSHLTGRDPWEYMQNMPQLFRKGGLFYQQVERDLGLVHEKHVRLPAFPGKVFRYNEESDLLELCMEPLGHFPVEPGIEQRVQDTVAALPSTLATSVPPSALTLRPSEGVKKALSVGSSGVIVNKAMQMSAIPFTGQGHSLSETSTASATQETSAMGSQGETSAVIEAENEEKMDDDGAVSEAVAMEIDKPKIEELQGRDSTTGEDSRFKRVGPGYTVFNQEVTNTTNEGFELLKTLASTIQELSALEGKEDEDPESPGLDTPQQPQGTTPQTQKPKEGEPMATETKRESQLDGASNMEQTQLDTHSLEPTVSGTAQDSDDTQHTSTCDPCTKTKHESIPTATETQVAMDVQDCPVAAQNQVVTAVEESSSCTEKSGQQPMDVQVGSSVLRSTEQSAAGVQGSVEGVGNSQKSSSELENTTKQETAIVHVSTLDIHVQQSEGQTQTDAEAASDSRCDNLPPEGTRSSSDELQKGTCIGDEPSAVENQTGTDGQPKLSEMSCDENAKDEHMEDS